MILLGIIKAYNKIYILDLSLFEQIFIKKTIKKFTLKIYDSIKIPNELYLKKIILKTKQNPIP